MLNSSSKGYGWQIPDPVQAEYKNPAKINEAHKTHTTSILNIVEVLH